MTTAITGKVCTFTYGTKAGEAQITTASVDEAASTDTIQTLGGSVAISQGIESTVGCDFLYDGETAGGFYAALKAALNNASTGVLEIETGTGLTPAKWSGDALVTSLSAEIPADGAVTCSAEFTISGALSWAEATP